MWAQRGEALWMMKLWMNLKWSHKICPHKLNQGMSWDPCCTCGRWHMRNSRDSKKLPRTYVHQCVELLLWSDCSVRDCVSWLSCTWLGSQQRNLSKSDTCHFRKITLKKYTSFLPSLSPFTRWMGREQRSLPRGTRWGRSSTNQGYLHWTITWMKR